ncbi:MAG: monovalent cation/H+ antiporter complex subunit F [Acidimicrobiaceae bacterium]|nr:monovalent cation/H+ antiporter complex subunit F [Acidimicrobiaceae bacterium]MCY4175834.1 monovalent cation/H+ antiporter complex subunit F [Acidimicrobiaceae bacterium]MCY4280927.1 monovalent cation/H+ antiporter complex subunit F [Acidimicrobiaceae bacterium]MCY4294789.1 monovalent cation/H+ antiporter complex subunit F [Acidimicrobiaceae bacterium]
MIVAVAIGGFAFAGLCGLYRLVRGPSLADRMIAVEVVLVSLAGALAVDAANRQSETFLVTLIVIALVGLAGTFAASRFLERDVGAAGHRGRQ